MTGLWKFMITTGHGPTSGDLGANNGTFGWVDNKPGLFNNDFIVPEYWPEWTVGAIWLFLG